MVAPIGVDGNQESPRNPPFVIRKDYCVWVHGNRLPNSDPPLKVAGWKHSALSGPSRSRFSCGENNLTEA